MTGSPERVARWVACLGMAVALLGCRSPALRTAPVANLRAESDASRIHVREAASEKVASRVAFVEVGTKSGNPAAAPKGQAEKNVLVVPMELDLDNGAANGNANLLRLAPAYEWPRRPRWRIQHMDLIVLADAPGGITGQPGNPEPVAGPRTFGLSDFTHLSFYAPKTKGSLLWGAGVALGIPTATDDVLGSGKWSAGPALRLTFRKEPWNLGVIGAQRWSFAGDSGRPDTDQLLLRGAFRRQLGEDWFFVSAPIITANWNAPSGEQWLVPVGGGLGRKFKFAGRPWAASLQGYVNAVRPTGAPTWSLRLTLTAFIPLDR